MSNTELSEPRLFTITHVERREADLRAHCEAQIAALTEQLAAKDRLIHEYQDKEAQE